MSNSEKSFVYFATVILIITVLGQLVEVISK